MAKIYRVIQKNWISFLKKMSIWSMTYRYQQSVFKRYYSDKHFSEFFLQNVRNILGCHLSVNKIFSYSSNQGGS